jgi:hypothetical protein
MFVIRASQIKDKQKIYVYVTKTGVTKYIMTELKFKKNKILNDVSYKGLKQGS